MASVEEVLAAGVVQHQAGRLRAAEEAYRWVLARQPGNAQVWYLFGGLAYQLGNEELAVQAIERAAELSPQYWFNLAMLLEEQGKLPTAIESFRRAIEHNPEQVEALDRLGQMLFQRGDTNEAAGYLRRVAELRPASAESQFHLGNALLRQDQTQEAIAAFRRAVKLKPNYADAYSNLGKALQDQRKQTEAIDCYRRALEIDPQLKAAHFNLGNALCELRRFDEAIDCYHRALELAPDFAEAYNGLGAVYRSRGQMDEAMASFRRACELKPELAVAQFNLGTASWEMGRQPEGVAALRRALALDPTRIRAHSNLLFMLQFCPEIDAAAIYAEHARWNEIFAQPLYPAVVSHANDRSPDRRLKIGYVSPDFRNHAQAHYLCPLLAAHDREQVEIVCYSDVVKPDEITERLRGLADGWRDIREMTDEQVAELVRADGIDVLVDLTMHMERNRLLVFARKPAPVQVTWLAYPGTTGLTAIDYRLSDPWLDPMKAKSSAERQNEPKIYSEETVRLRETFWCYDPLAKEPAVNELPAATNGFVTFGNLNVFAKMNPGVFKLWAKVLREVPQSRLMLLAPEGSCREWAADIFRGEGIKAERIEFVSRQQRPKYLEYYQRIDVGLDSLPYNGHTTSLDALWMGVPVVTIVGETIVGRAGLSQLSNLGLTELIAYDEDEFVRIATKLAGDLERLSALRGNLRERMERSPLMDGPRFARSMEEAMREMWRRWCGQ